MLSNQDLELEVGSEAYLELTPSEVNAICQKYDDVRLAGMKAFELLWKKFKPTYKMGKMYTRESEKYQAYRDIYKMYKAQLQSGVTAGTRTNTITLERDKWLG